MKRTILLAALCAMAFVSCKPSAEDYLQFLYDSMPLPDSLVFPREYWEANVAKTLEVRDRMGWDVPEREFRHFVLPLRVNNENLDDFRTVYADSLCARVQGMSIAEAALEINHWCHERATYVPSDGRTLGPMALIRSGVGRCGEESVLAVSALRAAGIPARQVYTPRWAHTDDNHAWVEVFVDGGWHFMGACEPESVLDLAWFNSSVSRAMLLHTKVFGNYDGPEDVISRTEAYTEINVIRSYIPTRRTYVTVVDESGAAVEGADVEFKIYNYAEFYTVAKYITGKDGRAALDTGEGDMVIWASKGTRFGLAVASAEENTVVLDRTFGDSFSLDLDIVPPVENPLPDNSTPEQAEINKRRLAEEDAIRETMPHPRTPDPQLGLTDKDAIDISPEVIADALSRPLTGRPYIDSPRVELEMLYPFRNEVLASGIADSLKTPSQVAAWVKDHVKVDDSRNPQGLRIPPVFVWRSGLSDSRSEKIFFVALCRALGFASRIDPVTSKAQYESDHVWMDVDFNEGTETVFPQGVVTTVYEMGSSPVKEPSYYTHYTFSRIYDGTAHLCEFSEYEPVARTNSLDAGYYMLTSGVRLASGSVCAHVEFFTLGADEEVKVPLVLRTGDTDLTVIGNLDAEKTFLPENGSEEVSILSQTGRGYFMICITGERDEPSVHAKGQLEGIADAVNEWGRKVVILDGLRPEGLKNAVYGKDTGGKVAGMILDGVDVEPPTRLPYVVVADSFGRIVYFSQGYNTSMGEQILAVLKQL